MAEDTIKEAEEVKESKNPRRSKGIVTKCSFLNIREEPSTSAKVLLIAKAGQVFMAEAFDDEWTHVYLPQNREGYVMTEFLKEV